MKRTAWRLIAAGALAAGVAGAQGPAVTAPKGGWKGELTPYAWLAGLEGEVKVNGRTAEFEKEAGDMWDMVELGGSLLGVARYDRILLWGQVDSFSLDTSEFALEAHPGGGSLDTKLLLGELAVGCQLDGWLEGQTFDLLVGVRTLRIQNELTPAGQETRTKETDLVDPIFVVRPSIRVFPSRIDGLLFNPTLAVGGGGDSDLVYEMQPQLQYQITDRFAARVGYRTVGCAYEGGKNKENELDFSLSGLIVGAGFTF